LTPLPVEEAEPILQAALDAKRSRIESAKRHQEFEKYYAERCARLGIPSEGPLSVEQVAIMGNHS